MTFSLRRRLLIILLGGTFLVWGAAALISYFDARMEADEILDTQLAKNGEVLLDLSQHELGEELAFQGSEGTGHPTPEIRELSKKGGYDKKIAYQVWVLGDRLVSRSPNAPVDRLGTVTSGYEDRALGGQDWRVYAAQQNDGAIQVYVAESRQIRDEIGAKMAATVAAPVLLTLPLLGVLIWLGVARGLMPLDRMAGQLSQRRAGTLTPLEVTHTPVEARPLVLAINDLFERLREAFDKERRFTADVTHELRTPLAALRAQAQVAERMTDTVGRQRALVRVIEGVDRASHLVQQLLVLARLDPEMEEIPEEIVDVGAVVAQTAANLGSMALAQDIELELDVPGENFVRATRDGIAVLARNLIDNALRYTPAGGRVRVVVEEHDGRICLCVEDSGPGIPVAERELVFRRFYRRLGAGSTGCGLGLSIVMRVAQLHKAEINLSDSRFGGLKFAVWFWAAPAPKFESVIGQQVAGL